MRERWPSTVFGETKSRPATCLVWSPWATSSATRRSVGVSAPEEGGRPPTRPSSARGALGPHPRADRLEAAAGRLERARAPRPSAASGAARTRRRAGCAPARAGSGRRRAARARSRSAATAPSTSPRAPASSPRQRAAAASADRRSSRRAFPSNQPSSSSAAARSPRAISASTWSGHDARRARLGDLLGAQEVHERAERADHLRRPADRQLEQAERGTGEVLGRAAVRAGRDRQRALGALAAGVDVARDRVGDRPQREHVRADRRLAGLLGQRVALVRVADRALHVAAHAGDLRAHDQHVGERALVAELDRLRAQRLERRLRAIQLVPPQPRPTPPGTAAGP